MQKIIFVFIYLLLLTANSFSQQIFLCRGYTESGEPIDLFIGNKIPVNQSFVILLRVDRDEIDNNIVFVSIQKSEARFDQNSINKMLRPDKNKNWIAFNHKISEEGIYTISFSDFNKKKLASSTIRIEKPQSKKVDNTQPGYFTPDLRIVFCERVVNGVPVGVLEKISLFKTNGEAYIYLINNMPLKSNKLLVNIWRKKTPDSPYDEFIDTKKFAINYEWYDTFFRYHFEKKGEYKINFFNEKELLLKTAYITVDN